MNEFEVKVGTEVALHVTVWNDDTQQILAENLHVLDLHGSEDKLKGGRFVSFNPTLRKNTVKIKNSMPMASPNKDMYLGDACRRRLQQYIEWINENIEGQWSFDFKDELMPLSSWGMQSFHLYPRFHFQDLEDAVLFKLRFY